jgi:hypothetical protein
VISVIWVAVVGFTELQGPLATPVAIVPVLLTNAIWGLATGAIALLVHNLEHEDMMMMANFEVI